MGQSDIRTYVSEARERALSDQALVQRAIDMARAMYVPTLNKLHSEERAFLSAVGRLVADEPSRLFVEKLCGRVFREGEHAAECLKDLLAEHGGVPTFFSSMGRLRIKAAAMAPRGMQSTAIAEVKRVFRSTFGELALPTQVTKVARKVETFAKEGISLALHPLSPGKIGEASAARYAQNLAAVLEKQQGVSIVVQPWRLFPGITPCSPKLSAETLAERLCKLVKLTEQGKRMVVLETQCSDTLPIIVEAFKRVLDHPECSHANIALELPGYLKTSSAILRELVDWATPRAEKGSTPVKVLLVKGSHLDEEQRCASMYGTGDQLCTGKAEAEAAYIRLLNEAINSPANAITPIIGTHELSHLCYAALRWARSGREGLPPVSLTYGVGNHLARQFAKLGAPALLIAGIASEETEEEAFEQYLLDTVHEYSRPGGVLSGGYVADAASVDWPAKAKPMTMANSARGEAEHAGVAQATGYIPGDLAPLLDRPYVDAFYEAAAKEKERPQSLIPLTLGGEECVSPLTFIHRSLTVPGLEDYRFISADYTAVNKALELAQQALAAPSRSEEERTASLKRAARALSKNSAELAALLVRDGGFTLKDAQVELRNAMDACRFYAHDSLKDGLQDGTTPQPIGVVVVAGSMAHPLADAVGGIAAAWIGGNSIIYKPAAYNTLVGVRLAALLREAGIELLCVPCMDNEIGLRLMTDARVSALICTATKEQTATLVKKAPAGSLLVKPLHGASVFLSSRGDWHMALQDIVEAAFRRSGQSPSCPHIIIAEAAVYDDPAFLPAVKDAVGSLNVKPTWLEGADLGPLAAPLGETERTMLTERSEGEAWAVLPATSEMSSLLWSPGVCVNIDANDKLVSGGQNLPLIGIMRVESRSEAINIQNRLTECGLAIIYSKDAEEVTAWRGEMHCLTLAVNCCPGERPGASPVAVWRTSLHGSTTPTVGGKNFAAALCHWQETTRPSMRSARRNLAFDPKSIFPANSNAEDTMRLSAAADSISYWWEKEFSTPSNLPTPRGELTELLYRPMALCLRIEKAMSDTDVAIALMAAMQAGCKLQISMAEERPWVATFAEQHSVALSVENRQDFENDFPSLAAVDIVVRDPAAMDETFARAAACQLSIINDPVLSNGRIELLRYLRESLHIERIPIALK